MYNLPEFKAINQEEILAFMRQHPFAMVTGIGVKGGPVATHLPLFIDVRHDKIVLSGHLMRSTDHHLGFEKNTNVLVIFTGPQAYVSASWYKDPHTASTWNYMAVHATGHIRFMDHEALINILERTTDHFENDDTSPANFRHLPKDYIEKLSKAIVAFEIEVTRLDHVFKMSQNKDRETYLKIMKHLENGGDNDKAVAKEMKKRFDALFQSSGTYAQPVKGIGEQ